MELPTVLILGSMGNLGSQLVKLLPTALTREADTFDFTDADTLQTSSENFVDFLNENKPKLIINAMAFNDVEACEKACPIEHQREECEEEEEDEDEFDQTFTKMSFLNASLPGLLADWCLDNDAVLVHYSTDYVFNGQTETGYDEDCDTDDQVNSYGLSKKLGEDLMLVASEIGLKYYLIRTSKLFGPKGDGGYSKPSFFEKIKVVAEKDGVVNAINEQVSCFTYTVDLAKATMSLINDCQPYGVYHLINEDTYTWYEAANLFFALSGTEVIVNPVNAGFFPSIRAERPQNSTLINTKAQKLRTLEEALLDYIKTL